MTLVCASRRSGAAGAFTRARYINKSPDECIKELSGTISNDFPNAKVESVTIADLDRLDPVIEDSHTYTVPDFVTDAGGFSLMRIPWSDRLHPDEALSSSSRLYPYEMITFADTITETMQVRFPAGYTLAGTPKPARFACAAGEYRVSYAATGGGLKGTRTFIQKKLAVEPDEYPSFKKFYNDALKEDNRQFVLKKGK
jgi:hypothetical protein